jgi:aminoglycoside phosphotransferase (APT) family kinase protein
MVEAVDQVGGDRAVADPQGVDLQALRGWMDREGLGSGAIEGATLLAGGTQNILLRFTRAGRGYVLRRPPVHLRANSNETMRREARVLAALAGTAVPHPALLAACGDESVIGAAFTIVEPIDGFTAPSGLPPLHQTAPVQHRMGLATVEAIAALGAVDYRAVGLDGFGKTDNYLGRQVARWQAQLASYADLPGWTGPGEIPGVARVADWLTAHQPADFRPGIIHGDFHLGNVMFRNDCGDIAAVLDWELSTIGDPLLDLGWMLATWPEGDVPVPTDVAVEPWVGFPTASELVAHYAARTDRSLAAIDWYVVLACYKLGIILEGTHARACAGQAPRETGDQLHDKTIALFARALRRIG